MKVENIQTKKRMTLMPLVNLEGKFFQNLIIFNGKSGCAVDQEVKNYTYLYLFFINLFILYFLVFS